MISSFKIYYKFFAPIIILISLWIIGTIGYVVIDNYNWFDAFYMTVITVSTVGYGEVEPLSDAGRIFTACLIMLSFGTFAYAISAITKFVIQGEFNLFIKQRKLNATIEKLTDHVIICGYGRNGRQAAQVLRKHNKRFVVVEKNEDLVKSINHKYSDLVLIGDGTQDDTLLKAGVMNASALITTLPVDADNLFIVLTARNLNGKLTIISRASDDNSDTKLKIAGANNVIMPDKVGGDHMASLVLKPDVVEFIDFMTTVGNDKVSLEEICVADVLNKHVIKTIKDIAVLNTTGANIIGFKAADGDYVINPVSSTSISAKTKLFVLGTAEQIAQLKYILN